MFAHERSFQYTRDYALLREALGNLTPSVTQIEQFCRLNPGWDWDNFPINPQIFPKHPTIKGYCVSENVFRRLQRLMLDSDSYSVEHSFLLGGSEYTNPSQSNWGNPRTLFYSEIHSNRGQSTCNVLSAENIRIRDAYNTREGYLMVLGHTHPNYGNTRKCFSIADLLYGITNSIWLRNQVPQPKYKVLFAIAYTGDNGICHMVPLLYDPTSQQQGGSAIFRLA